MEWKETSGILLPRSRTIFLKLMNGGASSWPSTTGTAAPVLRHHLAAPRRVIVLSV